MCKDRSITLYESVRERRFSGLLVTELSGPEGPKLLKEVLFLKSTTSRFFTV